MALESDPQKFRVCGTPEPKRKMVSGSATEMLSRFPYEQRFCANIRDREGVFMDPESVTQSVHDAGTAAKSAASAGHKVKKAWEWGEHIHFAHFVWTSVLVPAPAIILSIAHWTERAAHSFWSLLVLTAPL